MKHVLRSMAVACLAFVMSGCGVHTVDTGHRGIKVSFGQVEGDPLPEGLYFVNPFTTSIHEINTQVQKWDADSKTYTKDVQTADVNFTLNYKLRQSEVGNVYRTVGEDWEQKLIGQVVHQDIKDVIAQWDAVDLIANRQKASDSIAALVTADLDKKGIDVTGFFLTGVTYSPEFNNAVEAKVIAQQNALQAQNKTEQIKQEASQKVISAQAEAESMKIRATALESNPKLVEWEAVQKWDGHLPQVSGTNTPFINFTH